MSRKILKDPGSIQDVTGIFTKSPGSEQGHFHVFPGHRTGTLDAFSGTKYPNFSLLGTDWLRTPP